MSEKEPNNLLSPLSSDVSPHQLPKSSILRGKSAFEKLFKASNTFRSGSILFRYCQVPLSDSSTALPNPLQTAFIAPKRIGNAVIRNKTKRILRETFRTSNKELQSFLKMHSINLHLALVARYSNADFELVSVHMRKGLNNLVEKLACDINTFNNSEEI